ncbi:MAG: hypothetical protein ACLGJC_05650 [Alphaproteobacteria bacterium]
MASKGVSRAADGVPQGCIGHVESQNPAHRFAAWVLVIAFLFVLCADTLLGVVFRPYLDGGTGDTTVWDVLILIFVGSPE